MFTALRLSSGIANHLQQQSMEMALRIATYVITSSMSGFGDSVETPKLGIMTLLTTNTFGRITT
jgi:hypothetical protein